MKRTTIMLPDELAALLELERRRQDRSAAEIVRRALQAHLNPKDARRLGFAALGGSGRRTTARKAETILAREWGKGERAAASARGR